jgi:hypothetical protein
MLIKTVLATCIAATFSLTALPSMAADMARPRSVWARQGPPELRVEQAPAMRRGFQWVPGYWNWQHQRHVWQAGTWVRERPGYVYAQPNWVEDNGRWNLQAGRWSRRLDRDGDGVPNGQDRRPNDPHRR